MWVDCRMTSEIKMGRENFGNYFTATAFLDRMPGKGFYTQNGECRIDYNLLKYLWLRCVISFEYDCRYSIFPTNYPLDYPLYYHLS